MKRWHAVLSALLFLLPQGATAADDVGGAARELARKTVAFAGRGAQVSVTWRTLSSLDSTAAQARAAFETALQEAGLRLGEVAPSADLHLTVSENATQFLLVEEAAKGDEHQVWIAAWKRSDLATTTGHGVAPEKKLVWEQEEQILDVVFPGAGMLVLSPSNITLYARTGGQWEPQRSLAVTPAKPWPRDLRGHLRLKGAGFEAFLPGLQCNGVWEPALSLDCHSGDEPWVLESGSRALLLANFAATRNYFDGRVTTQSGQRKAVPPFFSAASVEAQGRTLWLLSSIDGRTRMFDGALDPAVATFPPWGSDLTGMDAHCGAGGLVLATRTGDRGQADSLQAYTLVDRSPQPLAEAVDFPGPVMALWTSGGNSAMVVVRDLRTGKHSAYVVTVVCGE